MLYLSILPRTVVVSKIVEIEYSLILGKDSIARVLEYSDPLAYRHRDGNWIAEDYPADPNGL